MAGEIANRIGFDREHIVVAPLGVSAPFVANGERGVLPDGRPYVLHVGAHDMRKNIPTLVAAWQAAFPTADVALVFTQQPDVLPPGAVVIDAPADEDLARFYRGAMFVAVPSLDEGFGLPLLEALACGAPAVASHIAALPEVGGDAVEWVDDPGQRGQVGLRVPGTLARPGCACRSGCGRPRASVGIYVGALREDHARRVSRRRTLTVRAPHQLAHFGQRAGLRKLRQRAQNICTFVGIAFERLRDLADDVRGSGRSCGNARTGGFERRDVLHAEVVDHAARLQCVRVDRIEGRRTEDALRAHAEKMVKP